MREQINILVKLQKIETESGKIKAILNDLPTKLNVIDAELKTVEQSIAEKTSLLDEMKKKYRAYEADIQMNNSKIKKREETLRGVKTNKEYQSLLKEIDDLKKNNSEIESAMLESLDQTEGLEKEISAKKDEYSRRKKEVDQEKKRIKQDTEKGEERIANLDTEWKSISKNIEAGLLKKFIAVKSKVGAPAIAPVKSFVCQGCNLNIPPQMYNELQRCDSLKFCPNCQRLIYYEVNNEKLEVKNGK